MSKLTRDQLAKFLPDNQAVRAFEQLFQSVNDTISTVEGSINSTLGTGRAPNLTMLEKRLEALELTQQQRENLTLVYKQLNELKETAQSRGTNLSMVEQRLSMLEVNAQRPTSLSEITQRLNAIESFIGI